ncbi:MAG: hypothetical protein IJ156_03970 [Bacteroidales bacterium]|nr:hypothetical protein [Bacteroidales bacterium]
MENIPTYALEAWTDEGEVHFSGHGLCEQLGWYEDDTSVADGEKTWADYERLTFMIWSRGMFLLSQGECRESYDCFWAGAKVCEEAIRVLKVPADGGLHPFLIAFDEMYEGCNQAALEEGYALEEVFDEDALQDIRQGLWKKAPEDLREDIYDDFPSPSIEETDRMVENYRISFSDSAAEKLHDKSVYFILRSMMGIIPSSLLRSLLDTLDEHDLHQITRCIGGMQVSGMAFSILEERTNKQKTGIKS